MAHLYALSRTSDLDSYRYIGITKYEDPYRRFKLHMIRRNNGHSLPVYDWMRKYDDVTMVVLQSNLSWEEACAAEIEMIKELKSQNFALLNVTAGGEGFLDVPEEVIEKLRKASTGRKHTEETKKKMSEAKKNYVPWNKGIPCREETKKKLSEANTGKVQSEEARRKKSEKGKGRKHTEEAKKKIGDAHRGKYVSPETREKLSKASTGKSGWNKGIPMTEEAKRNLSEKTKGRIPWNKKIKTEEVNDDRPDQG